MSEGRSLRHLAARGSDLNCPKCKDAMKQLKIAQEEIERLKNDFKNQLAEAAKREEELREENKFLRLPKEARRRMRDQDARLKRKQINKLKNDLHRQQGDIRTRPLSLGSSYTSSPSTTASSTPRHVDFTPTKEFDIDRSAPPRHTINWERGFMTTNQDYFRKSQNQLVALQEFLLDQQESICSEDSIPLETPRFRSVPTNCEDKPNFENRTCVQDSETEDISDASFRKRHAKLELKERNLVKSDKQHQMELYKRSIGSRKQKEQSKQGPLYSATELQKIEIVKENEIPLTIFGTLMPKISESDFRLPWLTTKEELNKERSQRESRRNAKRQKI